MKTEKNILTTGGTTSKIESESISNKENRYAMKLQSNCFYGKREAGSGESKYLRCLLLEAEEWKSFEFWGSFKPTMYVLLITECI